MALNGTAAYAQMDLPPLVGRAVRLAEKLAFPYSCAPEQGRLLRRLAAGARSSIAETGTGCGVGLAWLTTGAGRDVAIVSVEREPERAGAVAELFADHPNVTVVCGDWREIHHREPYDLLVLDGGGQGKADAPADPARLVVPGGALVIDDFTPADTWPPLHDGTPDVARLHWLEHPGLTSIELRLSTGLASVLAVRRPSGGRITFRSLSRADLPLLRVWLSAPHVRTWWREDLTVDGIAGKYGPRADDSDATSVFVIQLDGEPVGLIQCYRHRDYPDWESAVAVADAAGIDYLIGAPERCGQGLGTATLAAFAPVVLVLYPEVGSVVAVPQAANLASRRALEKAGFGLVRESGAGAVYAFAR